MLAIEKVAKMSWASAKREKSELIQRISINVCSLAINVKDINIFNFILINNVKSFGIKINCTKKMADANTCAQIIIVMKSPIVDHISLIVINLHVMTFDIVITFE